MKTSGALIAESLSCLKEPLAIVDTNLRLKFANRAFGELTEIGDDIVIGKELSKVLQTEKIDGVATLEQQMTGAFETIGNIGNINGKLVLAGKNNKKIPLDYGLIALNAASGSDAGLLVSLHSSLTSASPRKRKVQAAKQDPADESFTGLPSRSRLNMLWAQPSSSVNRLLLHVSSWIVSPSTQVALEFPQPERSPCFTV